MFQLSYLLGTLTPETGRTLDILERLGEYQFIISDMAQYVIRALALLSIF